MIEELQLIEQVMECYEQQIVLHKRPVETFQPVYDECLLVVQVFILETIAAQEEEQGHVEQVDEIEHPRGTAGMSYDHQDNAQTFGNGYGVVLFHRL